MNKKIIHMEKIANQRVLFNKKKIMFIKMIILIKLILKKKSQYEKIIISIFKIRQDIKGINLLNHGFLAF